MSSKIQLLLFLALACAVLISGKSTGKIYGKRAVLAEDPVRPYQAKTENIQNATEADNLKISHPPRLDNPTKDKRSKTPNKPHQPKSENINEEKRADWPYYYHYDDYYYYEDYWSNYGYDYGWYYPLYYGSYDYGSDYECSNDKFQCNYGDCIWNDDELCDYGSPCIPTNWICDGESDCSDGSDEVGCYGEKECSSDKFQCSNGNCIWMANDQCNHGSQCIPMNWVCDGENDCSDGSDEVECYVKMSASM